MLYTRYLSPLPGINYYILTKPGTKMPTVGWEGTISSPERIRFGSTFWTEYTTLVTKSKTIVRMHLSSKAVSKHAQRK